MKKQSKCLRPDCDKKVRTRGLCHTCYQAASNAVRSKKVTWEQLESHGKVLPSQSEGKIQSWILDFKK